MKAVALVLRVSTVEQADSRLGLESQMRLCREAAARECPGMPVVEFSDPGVSGSVPLAERKDGRRLTDAIVAGEIGVVVALTQDRLFRDMLDALATLARWDELGVRVLLVDGGWIDMENDEQWMSFTMRAFFAEMERRNARKRTKRALQAAKDRGKRIGGVPFGSRSAATIVEGKKVDGGVHLPVANEQAVIARIRLLRSERDERGNPLPYRKIAKRLTDERVPSPRGGEWSGEVCRRVVMRSGA